MEALTQDGFGNDDLCEQRFQKSQPANQGEIAEDGGIADDDGHASSGESSTSSVAGS